MKRRGFFKLLAAAPVVALTPSTSNARGSMPAPLLFPVSGNLAMPSHVHTFTGGCCSLNSGTDHRHCLSPCDGCYYEAVPQDPRFPLGPQVGRLVCSGRRHV